MAQEIVVLIWCDVCLFDPAIEAREEAAGEQVISIGGTTVNLALCAHHADALAKPLIDAMRYGSRPDAGPARPAGKQARALSAVPAAPDQGELALGFIDGRVPPCPECGLALTGLNGLTQHRRAVHGVETTRHAPCPQCGRVMANRQSVDHHMRRAHGTTLREHEGLERHPEIKCPLGGCEDAAPFGGIQGVRMHLRRAHGLSKEQQQIVVKQQIEPALAQSS